MKKNLRTNSKGKSQSTLPYHTFYPSHITKTKQEVIDKILTLARKGIPASQIGNILRDEEGVGQISAITHTTLVRILRLHNLMPAIPEDLNALVKKCTNMRAHLQKFRNDKDQKYRLIQTESRLYRLARYYKKRSALDAKWKPSFLLAASK